MAVQVHHVDPNAQRKLPQPPDSSEGRIIIRADPFSPGLEKDQVIGHDPQVALLNMDLNKFTPRLDGEKGSILSSNKNWLKSKQFDDLMSKLEVVGQGGRGDDYNPAHEVMETTEIGIRKTFIVAGVVTFILLVLQGVIMYGNFHDSGEEAALLPSISFVVFIITAVVLATFIYTTVIGQLTSLGKTFAKMNEMSETRAGFANIWSAQNGLELKYVAGRTLPEYFELSASFDGDEDDLESGGDN